MQLLKRLWPLLLFGIATHAAAQEQMTPEEIEAALQPKKPLTRSLKVDPNRTELDAILSRSIGVVERKKIVEITKAQEYPSLDFSITFGFDSAEIDAKSFKTLDALAAAMESDALREARFLVNGHTDSKGSDDYNLDLSQRRADAVVKYLERQHNINPSRLKPIGFGETALKNVDDGESPANRRVEIVNLP